MTTQHVKITYFGAVNFFLNSDVLWCLHWYHKRVTGILPDFWHNDAVLQHVTNKSLAFEDVLLLLLRHFSRVRLCAAPRQQPTRLRRPWDSPGKSTGVGCRVLLQCMKVKSESEVAQSCLTVSDPRDCSPPGSSIRGVFQARVQEWGAIAFSQIFWVSIFSFVYWEKIPALLAL